MLSQHYSTCSLWQELDLYIRSLLRMPRKLAEVREPRYFRPRFLCDSLSTPIRSLICVRSPTSSSSTLWLMTTEHSTNLQLHAVANILPSGKRKIISLNVYLTMTDIHNWQSPFWLGLCFFYTGNQSFWDFSDFWWLHSFRQLVVLNWMLLMSRVLNLKWFFWWIGSFHSSSWINWFFWVIWVGWLNWTNHSLIARHCCVPCHFVLSLKKDLLYRILHIACRKKLGIS